MFIVVFIFLGLVWDGCSIVSMGCPLGHEAFTSFLDVSGHAFVDGGGLMVWVFDRVVG